MPRMALVIRYNPGEELNEKNDVRMPSKEGKAFFGSILRGIQCIYNHFPNEAMRSDYSWPSTLSNTQIAFTLLPL